MFNNYQYLRHSVILISSYWFFTDVLFVEKADKGKCPFMANEMNATKTVEEPVQGETTATGNDHGETVQD